MWLLLPLYMTVSKNEISCSVVLNENLMVGCKLLAKCMKFSSSCLPWPHIMKISSMNLRHNLGFLGDVSISWISMYFINIFAYGGPSLFPWLCLVSVYIIFCWSSFFVNTRLASLHISSFFHGICVDFF